METWQYKHLYDALYVMTWVYFIMLKQTYFYLKTSSWLFYLIGWYFGYKNEINFIFFNITEVAYHI